MLDTTQKLTTRLLCHLVHHLVNRAVSFCFLLSRMGSVDNVRAPLRA